MKVGDYVRILPGVHDERMPANGRRDCLVVQVLGKKRDQINVMFHNREILKFHISQVAIISKIVKQP